MNELISVMIPAYNHEKYVQETIRSIIDQTYQNIELIVIDDGSSDATWHKINELKSACEARFVNVIFKTQENQGTCITLNRILECAKGAYVYLIASDDKATPDAIDTLYGFLSQNRGYALATGGNFIMDANSKQCYWDKDRNNIYDVDKAVYSSFSDFLMENRADVNFNSDEFGSYLSLIIGNYIPNGYLIRRDIFEKTGYFTTKAPLEDYYIMLQIAKYSKIKYIPKMIFYYRWHGNNSIMQADKVSKMIAQTTDYEMNLVKNSSDSAIKKIVNDFLATKIKKDSFRVKFLSKLRKIVFKFINITLKIKHIL